MRRKLTTVLSIATLVIGVGAVASAAGLDKAQGEVVTISPAAIHLNVDGTIEKFERTSESQVEDNLSKGDLAVIWYRMSGDTKSVARALLQGQEVHHDQMEPITTRERVDTGQQREQTAEKTADQKKDWQKKQRMKDEETQKQAQRHQQTEQRSQKRTEDSMSYEDYQRQSREDIKTRDRLPQTASNIHGLAIGGLLLIAIGAAFGLRTFRS